MPHEEYWAEQSRHLGPQTYGCCVCGSPVGGFANDGFFYCWRHMPPGKQPGIIIA